MNTCKSLAAVLIAVVLLPNVAAGAESAKAIAEGMKAKATEGNETNRRDPTATPMSHATRNRSPTPGEEQR